MDVYVPNPAAAAPQQIEMFEFVGKLLGVAVRTKHPLPFLLPSIVWKPLVGEKVDIGDIEAIDCLSTRILHRLRTPTENGVYTEADFEGEYRHLSWITTGSDGAEVELVAGGRDKRVTLASCNDYCAAVESYRLAEFSAAVAAMRRGMETIVPVRQLTLFTWKELEVMACGRPEIDIELLMAHTVSSLSPVTMKFVDVFILKCF
jgi:E3 ubiquitin-protein ligase HERC1